MKQLWKNIKSYAIFLASFSLVYALVLSCETVPELDPNPNPGNNDRSPRAKLKVAKNLCDTICNGGRG